MRRRDFWVGIVVAAAVLSAGGRKASAQVAGGVQPGGNSYLGPYANPYMGAGMPPYMMMAPNDPQAGMLTLLYLRRANGALGSGKLSMGGYRTEVQPRGVRPPALMSRTIATPAAGAERYFGRLPERGARAADYFGRSRPSVRR